MKLNLDRTLHELAKFQFVLAEGRKGNHLLFDREMIRLALTRSPEQLSTLFKDKLEEINEALNKTFDHPTFEDKRRFISTLPAEIRDGMIFGYFQLIEGGDDVAASPTFH